MPHRARPGHARHVPSLVTLRAKSGLDSLRNPEVFNALGPAFRAVSGDTFRVVHFSVQRDHVHLLAEASDRMALARGIHALAIRIARAINRVLARRGAVFSDRYHARDLPTPRAVRNGLVYVLANARKHLRVASGLDPYSSATAFDGWASRRPDRRPVRATTPLHAWTADPRTWLLRLGWRRHGEIDPDEAPARSLRARRVVDRLSI